MTLKSDTQVRRVGIVGGVRIPFARAGTAYAETTTLELLRTTMKALVDKYSLVGQKVDDIALGSVIQHSEIWNLAREAMLECGLSLESPAFGVARACGTGLDAVSLIANKIALGQIEVGIAGGADSMSDLPVFHRRHLAQTLLKSAQARDLGSKVKPWLHIRLGDLKPGFPAVTESKTGLSMGQHCELMAQDWQISRSDQDSMALRSHQNAVKAYEKGFYRDWIVPCAGLDRDNNVRVDSSFEKLSKLKPVFERGEKGTLTAGNSSPLTDGASCVLLASDTWAKKHSLEIQAYLTDHHNAAIDFTTEGLLMGPAYAIPRLLERADLKLQEFDFYEFHEAFAAQVLCNLRAWQSEKFCRSKLGLQNALGEVDPTRINVSGGSIALGHPFAATGGRIVATAAKLLAQKGSGRCLIFICTGGGMASTAILER